MDLYFMLAAVVIWVLATVVAALSAREYRKSMDRLRMTIRAWEVQIELYEKAQLRFLKALNELHKKNY